MENFGFGLTLVDKVGAPAKKAADALRLVDSQAKKAQSSLDFSKEIERTEQAIKKLQADPKGFEKLIKAQKELREQRKKIQEEATGKKEGFFSGLTNKLNFGNLATAAFAGEVLAEGAMKVGETLVEAAHKVVEIFTEGIAKAFEESGKEETRRLAFGLSLGAKGGGEALGDITRFSKLSQFTRDETAAMFLPLRRAGFDQKGARSAFAAAADIQAGGGNAQEALDAFTRIKAKGGIGEKQLISLLGSTGGTEQEFYKQLGKSLGVGAEAAKKRAEEGKLDPQLLLNQIYSSIEQKQGGKLGTGGIAASKTFEARVKKLKDLPNEYFEKLVDSPGFKKVSDAFGSLLESLDPEKPRGQRIMASLNAMFDKITGWFDDLTSDDGIDKLSDGIGTVVAVLEKAVDIVSTFVDLLRKAAGIAETVAAPLAKAMDYGDRLLGRHADQSDDEFKEQLRQAYAAGAITKDQIPQFVARHKAGLTVNIPQINVINHGGERDDTHTAQKVAQEVHRHVVDAVERANQEQ